MPHRILNILDTSTKMIIDLQKNLVAIPALGPTNGGAGEQDKVAWLVSYLDRFSDITCEVIKAPDDRVPCGFRPSLVIRRPGQKKQTLWLIAHTDVVPTGDLGLWNTDPFTLHVDGDFLYGRGVEDNHQGMVSALLVLEALEEAGVTTDLSLGILLVADEETGNAWGIEYVMREHAHIFQSEDLILIPDFGTEDGASIEIAEKSVLWLKFLVQGQQCHASTPEQGINSLTAASALILGLEKLKNTFDAHDPLFSPPISTFVPTKKEANVPNINTMPGRDVFYLDCRILPCYALDSIEQTILALCADIEQQRSVHISMSVVVKEQAAAPTAPSAPIVTRLTKALEVERGVSARYIGIGGGTVAASFRKRNLPAACWATLLHTAHQPNEHSSITNTLADARVFARLLFDDLLEKV